MSRGLSVACVCDACQRTASCGPNEAAPKGWYYLLPPGGDFRFDEPRLACTSVCRDALKWRRAP